MEFKTESWNEFSVDADALFEEQYAEVAHYQDIPLVVDHDTYRKIDELGLLSVCTAREKGRLIGYAVFFLKNNIHYKTSFQAHQDIFYVHPDYRGRWLGIKLIKFSEEVLKEKGVQVVYHHVKADPKLNFGTMLERQEYELVDLIYGKRLDKE